MSRWREGRPGCGIRWLGSRPAGGVLAQRREGREARQVLFRLTQVDAFGTPEFEFNFCCPSSPPLRLAEPDKSPVCRGLGGFVFAHRLEETRKRSDRGQYVMPE